MRKVRYYRIPLLGRFGRNRKIGQAGNMGTNTVSGEIGSFNLLYHALRQCPQQLGLTRYVSMVQCAQCSGTSTP